MSVTRPLKVLEDDKRNLFNKLTSETGHLDLLQVAIWRLTVEFHRQAVVAIDPAFCVKRLLDFHPIRRLK